MMFNGTFIDDNSGNSYSISGDVLEKITNEALEKTNSPEEYGDYINKKLQEYIKSNSLQPIEDSPKGDNVEHPNHYKSGIYECMDVMQDVFGEDSFCEFCYLNAFKYLWRSKNKNGVEDIKKAVFYLQEYIKIKEARYEL